MTDMEKWTAAMKAAKAPAPVVFIGDHLAGTEWAWLTEHQKARR